MLKKLIDLYNSWSNLFKINKLSAEEKKIVFYAETISDWVFLDPIVDYLKKNRLQVIKITSDTNDEILNYPNNYYIGMGSARTFMFRMINAKAFILTLTNLDTHYLKKSAYPVTYFYVFHSLVSTHRAYREFAFDAYDIILCSTKYHVDEIKKNEINYDLPKKQLEMHGYGRLDSLIKKRENIKNLSVDPKRILIAPTWGHSSIVNNQLWDLTNILINLNFHITIRLHPMTLREDPTLPSQLIKKFHKTKKFTYDSDQKNELTLIENNTVISDWSGTAMEFAFANLRPVIFIDTDPKINNQNWKELETDTFEDIVRNKIGKIVQIDKIKDIPKIIENFNLERKIWAKKISKLRDETIFNVGNSGKIGADIIRKYIND